MVKINKTNAARLLDKAKIAYELIPYEVDENDLSAVHVAASLGEDINCVFKTLILHGDKSGYFVCVIPGEHEVDLKLAAKASGNKKCDLIPVKELLPLTGYIRGGCSPIGMKKQFPTVFHETAEILDTIMVSAGKIGFHSDVVGGIAVYDAFPPGDGHIYQCTVSAVHEQTVSRLYLGSIFKIDSHPGKRGLRIDRIDLHNVKPEDKRSGEAHYLRNYIIFSFSGSKPDVFLTLLHYPRPHRSSSDQSVSSFFLSLIHI